VTVDEVSFCDRGGVENGRDLALGSLPDCTSGGVGRKVNEENQRGMIKQR
jgi:hypothetical protein